MDPQRLQAADATAPSVVVAVNVARIEDTGTKNRPMPFLCSDGGIYWLKPQANASEASAELIAGRLGRLTGHAPAAVVVRVPQQAVGNTPELQRFVGVSVGIRDIPGAENSKDLQRLVAAGSFRPNALNHGSWIRSVTFQSWIGVTQDPQALVVLTTGEVFSADHEFCFAQPLDPTPTVCDLAIGGCVLDKRAGAVGLDPALSAIEALTNQELLSAVAMRLNEPPCQHDGQKRLAIALELAARRANVRAVMETWVSQ